MTVPTAAASADSANDTSSVRIHDLGAMAIDVHGVETAVRWHKPARILGALLITPNRRVSIDTLVTVVWGDSADESTEATLMSHIWRLRKLMEPQRSRGADPVHLVNDRGGYRIVVNAEHADSLRFAELAGQGDLLLAAGSAARALPRYEEALKLWRGRPFESIADTQWAAASVARLEELHTQVTEQYIESLLRTGSAETAVRVLEEMITTQPFRERLWGQLMLGLYQLGRIEESLGAYRRARKHLVDELGVDPGPELGDLHRRILDHDPTLRRASQDIGCWMHLPALRSPLIGREFELSKLGSVLLRNRLVTVIGTGGVGKTRLAIEVARAAASASPDGVWFVDLAALDDPGAVPMAVLSAIGIAETATGTPFTVLRSYVRDRQVLLVMDNCEHLLPAVREILEALLGEDSQARVLATSREPLGVDGEVLWTLGPLSVISDVGIDATQPSPAAQMFMSKAESIDATFEAATADLAEIEGICAVVDGMPLAIELAANRIRSASLSEVREQVTNTLGALARIGYARIEHHRTVERSIEWSVQLLDQVERTAHRRLGALPGAFTVDAAAAVLATTDEPKQITIDLLSRLVHRSLLFVVPGTDPGRPTRFRQLATVRAHALTSLATSGEREAVLARRRGWVEDLVANRPDFDGPDSDRWYPRAAHNHDTLASVMHDTLVERPDPVGVHILAQLANYWTYQRRVSEGERWCQIALQHGGGTDRDRALVKLQLAGSLAYRNRCDLAVPLIRSVIAGPVALSTREYAHFLATTAWCAFLRGDIALDFVEDELRRIAAGDAIVGMWAELLHGKTLLATDRPQAALAHAQTLIERAAGEDNLSVAWLGSSLAASSALRLHDPDTSSAWLKRGVDFQRRIGNERDVGLLELQGNIAELSGDHRAAAGLFAQSSTLAFREGSPWPGRRWTESALVRVREALSVDDFEAEWQRGTAQVNFLTTTVSREADVERS